MESNELKLTRGLVHGQKSSPNRVNSESGFSLIEIIIVLGILGSVIALLVGNLAGGGEKAKIKETNVRASTVAGKLLTYQGDNRRMPTTEQGLGALEENPGSPGWGGPYVDGPDELSDAWGTRFEYELTGRGPKLISAGPDASVGTEDDLVYLKGKPVTTSAQEPAAE